MKEQFGLAEDGEFFLGIPPEVLADIVEMLSEMEIKPGGPVRFLVVSAESTPDGPVHEIKKMRIDDFGKITEDESNFIDQGDTRGNP